MLFHRALGPEEIQDLAAGEAPLGRQARQGQVLHLAFEEGQLRDSSPCGNHGQSNAAKRVAGRVGDGLLLEQPSNPQAVRRGRAQMPVQFQWTCDVPLMVRAMALAGNTLLVAGPDDLLDEVAAFQNLRDPDIQQQLAAQDAAFQGRSGGLLLAVDALTGKILSQRRLASPPVFDGLIVAAGQVLIATLDGRPIALAAE
jgi:hypothetical protein